MESNGHSNTCPKLHLACSCACLHCPVLSCTEKEGKREERGEREGERRRKKFGRQGRPAKAFWKNLKLKTRAPEQYDHRSTAPVPWSLISNPISCWAKKSGFTVRDSPGQSGTSTFVAKDSRDLFLGSWTITLQLSFTSF